MVARADLAALLPAELPEPDDAARAAVAERASQVLRPRGALARLDELASWLAGWQRSAEPAITSPAAVVFAADHGVADEGVSAYPVGVTAGMLAALESGLATASALAEVSGAALSVVDVGVGRPTANLLHEPALSRERFEEAFEAGRSAVGALDADLLVLGEMGIANTTSAAAVCAALFAGPVEDWTGRGTGIDDAGFQRKLRVVQGARDRVGPGTSPLEILRELGGAELAACAGAALEARLRSVPVVLDGFVVTASVAPLHVARPGALDHCVAGHRSPEPGHGRLLSKLGLRPLLDLELRLGEGSGGLLAVPLIRAAAAAVTRVATFADLGMV